jgi:toxin ParE1/3/4
MIAESPYSFESVYAIKKEYRFCNCGSDSIFFRIKEETVEIMTIVGKQDLNNIL